MKILHVLPSLDCRFGGPVFSAIEMLSEMTTEGMDVTLVSTVPRRPSSALRVYEFPSVIFQSTWGGKWGFSMACGRWLRKNIPFYDLVQIDSVFTYTTFVASRACRKHGIPYIVRPCGALAPYGMKRKRLKKSIYFRLIEKRNLIHAAAIRCVSQREADHVARVIKHHRLEIVPVGTNIQPVRAESGDKKNILFLGRFSPEKGITAFIEALRLLSEKRRDFHACLCGDKNSAYGRRIQRLIQDKKISDVVSCHDFIESREKQQMLSRAACLVLPSLSESLGLAAVEAMACQVPVVVSTSAGLAEDVMENKSGLVVNHDPASVADALSFILDQPDEARKMGEAGKRLVDEKYRWKPVVARLKNIYAEILKNKINGA